MVAEVFAGIGAFKTMFDIAKAMKNMDDAVKRNAAVADLWEQIIAAQTRYTAAVEQIRDLEEKLAKVEAWEGEKHRYELREVSTGVFAYTPKDGMAQGEPFHMLCAKCYEHREKSILQATQELRKARRVHRCPRCKSEYEMTGGQRPVPPPVDRGPPGGSWAAARRGR